MKESRFYVTLAYIPGRPQYLVWDRNGSVPLARFGSPFEDGDVAKGAAHRYAATLDRIARRRPEQTR